MERKEFNIKGNTSCTLTTWEDPYVKRNKQCFAFAVCNVSKKRAKKIKDRVTLLLRGM